MGYFLKVPSPLFRADSFLFRKMNFLREKEGLCALLYLVSSLKAINSGKNILSQKYSDMLVSSLDLKSYTSILLQIARSTLQTEVLLKLHFITKFSLYFTG